MLIEKARPVPGCSYWCGFSLKFTRVEQGCLGLGTLMQALVAGS